MAFKDQFLKLASYMSELNPCVIEKDLRIYSGSLINGRHCTMTLERISAKRLNVRIEIPVINFDSTLYFVNLTDFQNEIRNR